MNPLLEAALARAREGECLLPVWWTDDQGTCCCPKGADCPSPGKHPRTPHGLDDGKKELDELHLAAQTYVGPFKLPGPDKEEMEQVREVIRREGETWR